MGASETDLINAFIKVIADNALPAAKAMAAIGVLSMAILETAKNLLPLRRAFQRRFVRKWLGSKASEAGAANKGKAPNAAAAQADLVRLATSGDADALYDLPIEKLCGQVNAAAQSVIDFPAQHEDLLRCLASLCNAADVDLLLSPPAGGPPGQAVVDARARVIHQVQRSIDGLQIAADHRWTLSLRLTSFLLCFALTLVALNVPIQSSALQSAHFTGDPGSYVKFFLVAIAAGFIAPVAKDLVSALQQLRTP
jgi:hypothetical protein